jgi:hypothetical protein
MVWSKLYGTDNTRISLALEEELFSIYYYIIFFVMFSLRLLKPIDGKFDLTAIDILVIDCMIEQPLASFDLKDVRRLIIANDISQPLEGLDLKNVTGLDIRTNLSQPLKGLDLKKVTDLQFTKEFNQSLEGLDLENVTHLSLGQAFTQPLDKVDLKNITHLKVTNIRSLENTKLSEITHLSLGDSDHRQSNGLKGLDLGNVTHLTVGRGYHLEGLDLKNVTHFDVSSRLPTDIDLKKVTHLTCTEVPFSGINLRGVTHLYTTVDLLAGTDLDNVIYLEIRRPRQMYGSGLGLGLDLSRVDLGNVAIIRSPAFLELSWPFAKERLQLPDHPESHLDWYYYTRPLSLEARHTSCPVPRCLQPDDDQLCQRLLEAYEGDQLLAVDCQLCGEPICDDDSRKLSVLPCGHAFHYDCLIDIDSDECPLCSTPFSLPLEDGEYQEVVEGVELSPRDYRELLVELSKLGRATLGVLIENPVPSQELKSILPDDLVDDPEQRDRFRKTMMSRALAVESFRYATYDMAAYYRDINDLSELGLDDLTSVLRHLNKHLRVSRTGVKSRVMTSDHRVVTRTVHRLDDSLLFSLGWPKVEEMSLNPIWSEMVDNFEEMTGLERNSEKLKEFLKTMVGRAILFCNTPE